MKTIDYDFEKQFTAIYLDDMFYVADMHELVNPNESARRLNEAMKQRSLSDQELTALYENCNDPLVAAVKLALSKGTFYYKKVMLSLGDMVANRIDFGEGTDKSIVGKMAKKARELGVPQHVYIADNIEKNKQELQEYAHRNNLWTSLRFKTLDGLLPSTTPLTFVHMNGNADVISSFVSERVLPKERTPMQIFEASTAVRRYFEKAPGILLLVAQSSDNDPDGDVSELGFASVLVPHSLDFSKMSAALDQLKQKYTEFLENPKQYYFELHCGDLGVELRPNTFECRYISDLYIHEALRPDLCAKAQSVEGMAVYEKAMQLWPVEYVIHGHTHNPAFVKYQYQSQPVTQVPPNVLAEWKEITHENRWRLTIEYNEKGMLKQFKEM